MITILGGDGREYGPVSIEQLQRWLAEGRATPDTRVLRNGDSEWQRLGDLLEFRPKPPELPALPGTPPPLPTAAATYAQTIERVTDIIAQEGLPLASRSARLGAALIDGAFSMLAALPGLFLLGRETLFNGLVIENFAKLEISPDTPGFDTLALGMILATSFQVTLLALRGQTLGKWIARIRIVRLHEDSHAGFFRTVVLRGLLPGLLGGIPVLGPFFTIANVLFIFRDDRRCLHDLIAGTRVVALERERVE